MGFPAKELIAAATPAALLSSAVKVCVAPPTVRVYCVGLPEGSADGSQVHDVWETAAPAAVGVSCCCRLFPDESRRSTVDTPSLVLCSWMRSSGLSAVPRLTTVACTGAPDNSLNRGRYAGGAIVRGANGE